MSLEEKEKKEKNWMDKGLELEVRNCGSSDELWVLNFGFIVLIIIILLGVFFG